VLAERKQAKWFALLKELGNEKEELHRSQAMGWRSRQMQWRKIVQLEI
jgi:hypothetical protein